MVCKGTLRGRVGKVVEEMVQAAGEGACSSDRSEGVATSSVGTASGDSAASTAVVIAVCPKAKARDPYTKEELLFKLQLILFRDSGGQPQFQAVVTAFSHNVSLVLVFIKLNGHLDALCTNAFTNED